MFLTWWKFEIKSLVFSLSWFFFNLGFYLGLSSKKVSAMSYSISRLFVLKTMFSWMEKSLFMVNPNWKKLVVSHFFKNLENYVLLISHLVWTFICTFEMKNRKTWLFALLSFLKRYLLCFFWENISLINCSTFHDQNDNCWYKRHLWIYYIFINLKLKLTYALLLYLPQ